MKQVLVLILFFAFTLPVFAQQITKVPPSLTKTYYLEKSKKQIKTAWIMIGGGAACFLTGVIIPKGESKGFTGSYYGFPVEEYKNDGIKAAFGVGGVLSMLGSIPFFIASGKNKKRANRTTVFIDVQEIPSLYQTGMQNQSTLILKVKIGI